MSDPFQEVVDSAARRAPGKAAKALAPTSERCRKSRRFSFFIIFSTFEMANEVLRLGATILHPVAHSSLQIPTASWPSTRMGCQPPVLGGTRILLRRSPAVEKAFPFQTVQKICNAGLLSFRLSQLPE